MDLVEGIKSRKQKMHMLIDLARSHVNHGKVSEAEGFARDGLALAREFGKTFREAQALKVLAEVHLYKGDHFEAMSLTKKSKKISTKDGDKEGARKTNFIGNATSLWLNHDFQKGIYNYIYI